MAEFGLINWIVLIVYFFGMLYIGVIFRDGVMLRDLIALPTLSNFR